MSEYGKIESAFWRRGTGKRLRGCMEAQVLASYLMTCPSRHMSGLFYLPLPVIAHETGVPFEGVRKGLQRLREENFALYDEDDELVFLPNMARIQAGDSLMPSDHRHTSIVKQLDLYRKHAFCAVFLEIYGSDFNLFDYPAKEGKAPPFKDPSKTLQSQEQEQEHQQEHEQGEKRADGGDDIGPAERRRLAAAVQREPGEQSTGKQALTTEQVAAAWADACAKPGRRSPGLPHKLSDHRASYQRIRDVVNAEPDPPSALASLFEWEWSDPAGPIAGKRASAKTLDPKFIANGAEADLERALGRAPYGRRGASAAPAQKMLTHAEHAVIAATQTIPDWAKD